MRRLIRRLSPWGEFAVVVSLAFGPLILSSTLGAPYPDEIVMGNQSTIELLVFEVLVLAIVLSLLYVRDWPLRRLAPKPTMRGVGTGIGLYIAIVIFYWLLCWGLVALVGADTIRPAEFDATEVSTFVLVLVVVINPIFEECLVAGYVMTALARFGPFVAIMASTLIRLLYHTYQGPTAVPSIISMSTLLGVYYWKTGKLWPLVVAHALGDFVPFIVMAPD